MYTTPHIKNIDPRIEMYYLSLPHKFYVKKYHDFIQLIIQLYPYEIQNWKKLPGSIQVSVCETLDISLAFGASDINFAYSDE